jgi:hypothetical protein
VKWPVSQYVGTVFGTYDDGARDRDGSQTIHAHYLEFVTKKEAKGCFGITPKTPRKVLKPEAVKKGRSGGVTKALGRARSGANRLKSEERGKCEDTSLHSILLQSGPRVPSAASADVCGVAFVVVDACFAG